MLELTGLSQPGHSGLAHQHERGYTMTTGIRYFITVLLAVFVTLSAFYLMHLLIDQRAGEVPQLDPVQVIQFGPVHIPEPPPREPRTPPERPEPPDQPPPPSELAITQIEPIQTVVEFDPPPRNLVDTGPSRHWATPQPAPGGESDRNARPRAAIAPPYPRPAAIAGIEGWVEVEVIVRADGTVRQARVLRANPARVFDDAALNAVRRWTWSPGMVAGRAVEQTVVQMIEFNLSGH
jgi:periplasmic protein TonB